MIVGIVCPLFRYVHALRRYWHNRLLFPAPKRLATRLSGKRVGTGCSEPNCLWKVPKLSGSTCSVTKQDA